MRSPGLESTWRGRAQETPESHNHSLSLCAALWATGGMAVQGPWTQLRCVFKEKCITVKGLIKNTVCVYIKVYDGKRRTATIPSESSPRSTLTPSSWQLSVAAQESFLLSVWTRCDKNMVTAEATRHLVGRQLVETPSHHIHLIHCIWHRALPPSQNDQERETF